MKDNYYRARVIAQDLDAVASFANVTTIHSLRLFILTNIPINEEVDLGKYFFHPKAI